MYHTTLCLPYLPACRFGEATENEMCFNLMSYYPRQPQVEACLGYGGANATAAVCTSLTRSVNVSKAVAVSSDPWVL